jgi:hypothetical protein
MRILKLYGHYGFGFSWDVGGRVILSFWKWLVELKEGKESK